MNSFSHSEQEKIINFLHQYPFIWDLSHEDYHDIVKRDHVFTEIGNVLYRSPQDVQKCWSAIRAKYIRIKKSIKSCAPKSGSGGGVKQKPNPWRFYPILSFLDGTFRKRVVSESILFMHINNYIHIFTFFH